MFLMIALERERVWGFVGKFYGPRRQGLPDRLDWSLGVVSFGEIFIVDVLFELIAPGPGSPRSIAFIVRSDSGVGESLVRHGRL